MEREKDGKKEKKKRDVVFIEGKEWIESLKTNINKQRKTEKQK